MKIGSAALLPLLVLLPLAGCEEYERVSQSGAGAYEASLTATPGGYAAAWYDDRDGNPEIYFRLLDPQGRPTGPEHRVTEDAEYSYEADIAWADGNVAIAWYDVASHGVRRAQLGLWTPEGKPLWKRVVSQPGGVARNTLVRANGSELFSAWIEDSEERSADVWGQWWSFRGDPLSTPMRLGAAGRTTWNLNAAIDARGEAWVVFDALAGTHAEELFLARASKTKTELKRLSNDDGFASKYPDIALSGDRAALTWFDERDGNKEVYLFAGPASQLSQPGQPGQPDVKSLGAAHRVTTTPGESIGAYVSWNGDRIGLAWCDVDNKQHEIFFRDFDSHGTALHAARRITETSTQSLIPAIQPASGSGFAIAWNEYVPKGPGHRVGGKSEVLFAKRN